MSENLNVSITIDEKYVRYLRKKIILLFLCFSASDVINDVDKQNKNSITSLLSAYHTERKTNMLAN